MSDPEPRRSVRATKGQHKALEAQDQPIEAPKRRGKKSKKAQPEPEEPEEEIIRCVCGAQDQDSTDPNEPWIACDTCGAWQHNICMGMSQYTEDLPKEYFCEQCRPENHKELLDGIKRGEKPWEVRRKAYEEEKAREKKNRGRKEKGKKGNRHSDQKEEASQASQKAKPSPAPEPKKETKSTAGQKRKVAEASQDKEPKAQKMRKVSESQAVPVVDYTPPKDLATKLSDLPEARQGPVKLLRKNLIHSISNLEHKNSDDASVVKRAERLAFQIERAVYDTHPSDGAYTTQCRTLGQNLKLNPELVAGLLNKSKSPNTVATMTGDEMATKERQKEVTEMKAKAEKQAVKITDPNARLIRKTHKGDEMVGDEGLTSEAVPTGPAPRPRDKSEPPKKVQGEDRRASIAQSGHSRSPTEDLAAINTSQQSPIRTDFDINKVFSKVKSPTLTHNRLPPAVTAPVSVGPGVDLDVDRMLDDDTQSPPYSPPREENDPDAVWRGTLIMNSVAHLTVAGKHMGGAKLNETIGLPWDQLIPKTLTVFGRIDETQAIVYLCGLRYSQPTDIVVVSLEPTSHRGKADMQKLIDYFISKKRYGVINEKATGNVRDTYLVPVLPGNIPEFMLNLGDNFIPTTRTEPMMLAVFVYRNDPETVKRVHGAPETLKLQEAGSGQLPGTPTPAQAGAGFPRPNANRQSISAPGFSPTSPQGTFPNYPTARNSHPPSQQGLPPTPTPYAQNNRIDPQRLTQKQGEQVARDVLGDLITSPTVSFLLPQAGLMQRKEWEVIKEIYETDPKARLDLPHLSKVLEARGGQSNTPQAHQPQAQPPASAVPVPVPAPAAAPAPPQPRHQPPVQHPVQKLANAHISQQPPIQQPTQHSPHPPMAHAPAVRNTPIPPPAVPPARHHQPPIRQTPIPPPPIPPQAVPAATPVHPPNPPV
ncbi:SPOC domain-containing protein [Rhypophila decipiens]|uniref:Transcription factor BYE1 n=1 Tax=Rhypophila decipiens TaxID=261697 RepID=A0AAN7B7X1_9PEZI|nr:SPOC domain-containing protein [Rhypophila decipiens]